MRQRLQKRCTAINSLTRKSEIFFEWSVENIEHFFDSGQLSRSVVQVQCTALDSGPLFPYREIHVSVFQKPSSDYSLLKTKK